MKRRRSTSARLRALSDLGRYGILSLKTKGSLKDRVIVGDLDLESAIDQYIDTGDTTFIQRLL